MIQAEPLAVMDSIMKWEFQGCFQQWDWCWARCINL